MKSLDTYINESSINAELLLEAISEVNENSTLQNVYEFMFDKMFENGMINEGFFSKLGKWAAKMGSKAEKAGEDADKKLDQLSDAGKAAIDNAKKKAGDSWDKVKGVYTNAVAAVDNAIMASKNTIADMAEKFKIKKDQLEATVASVYANAIAQGKDFGKKAQEWMANASKYPAQIAACVALITGAKMAISAGYDSSMILDLLSSAGVN